MNLLSDTLNDFESDLREIYSSGNPVVSNLKEKTDELIEEYVERIKNELSNEKYLK